MVMCRHRSRSLAALRDQMMESSATREYPSLIQTFFQTHTVGRVFLRDEDRALYDEMLRLHGLGSNGDSTPEGVPTQMMRSWPLFERASSGGTFPVLVGYCQDRAWMSSVRPRLDARTSSMSKSSKRLFRSDDKFSQMLNQYESTPEFGSESGGCGDDEMADDEDGGEDEEGVDSYRCYIWLNIDLYLADNAREHLKTGNGVVYKSTKNVETTIEDVVCHQGLRKFSIHMNSRSKEIKEARNFCCEAAQNTQFG
ncbi:hypothetical protein Tco_0922814 [Tanacetum coccineum]|uniref:Uncharacterized protein n=1 Tax=Tanacetum coccineum TaxID=301880 RepID=A0ABQ5D0E2_9ASTR